MYASIVVRWFWCGHHAAIDLWLVRDGKERMSLDLPVPTCTPLYHSKDKKESKEGDDIFEKPKKNNTQDSNVVPHRSTN